MRALLLAPAALIGCATTPPAPAATLPPSTPVATVCPTTAPERAAFMPGRVLGGRVEKVCLVGAGDETSLRLREELAPREGTKSDEDAVRSDLSALFATGLIREARVYGDVLPSKGVRLTYVVVERALVTTVRLEGAPALTPELRHQLEVKGFRDTATQRARLRDLATQFYESQGYAEAAIDFEPKPVAGGVELVMKVTEGPRFLVQALSFEGAKAIAVKELEKVVQTKPGNPVRSEVVAQDALRLNDAYFDRGYVAASVSHARLALPSGATDVTFTITEGPLFRVGDIVLKGALTPAALKGLETKKGAVFSPAAVRRDLERLRERARKDQGELEVTPFTELDEQKKTVKLTFEGTAK
ncbi:MAG: hypothetical protein JNJ54_29895 [Myxococcaceae bacterium]|nr:hypothetical protein [Myxococcaceae bacterium]